MKVPVSWLREWVDTGWTAVELGERLTLRGFEVEAITPVAPPFSGVVTARILAVEPHPAADKLRVCRVDAGSGEALQIVCGAANARAGLTAALAAEGAVLPGGTTIKRARLRGVESRGMLCSARELGLSDDGGGLLELSAELAPGRDLRAALDLDDAVLEIAVTPNRGDAMSVLGIAREVAAASGVPLGDPIGAAPAPTGQGAATWPVKLTPGAGCASFARCVIEAVDNTRASPPWLQRRLERCGVRSISPIVDVTNLIVHELGQPMHAYDRALLAESIVVRRAQPGEKLTLLDGRQVALEPDVLVIADARGPVGLAGIMGGERTAIVPGTRDVVLEVAWFDPAAIAGRARRYGMTTDASQRFERGVDPALQRRALLRAVQLMQQLAGGTAGPVQVEQIAAELPARPPVHLRSAQAERLLGLRVSGEQVRATLAALGMQVKEAPPDGWLVQPPSWRFDIALEADLVEEIARSIGLDQVPECTPTLQLPLRARSECELEPRTVAQLLAARGYSEAVSLGFVDSSLQARLLGHNRAPRLANPIASNLDIMRASLWPGLVGAALHNVRRQQARCRLFELASCFGADGRETVRVAAVAVGERLPEQWAAERADGDYYDVRCIVEALLALRGPDAADRLVAGGAETPPALHPGQSACVHRDGRAIGWLGCLHPALQRELDLTYPVTLFELELAPLLHANAVQFAPLSSFPAIRRDLSFTVPEQVAFSEIAARVSVAARDSLQEVRVFDIYQGKGVENGRKSVALGLILQDLSRTLSDADADRVVAAVLSELTSHLGATLRE